MQPAEARWFATVGAIGVARFALCLMETGFQPNTAFGVARFVESRSQRQEDSLSPKTRSKYRGILDELDPDTIGSDQFRGSSIGVAA